MEHSLRQQRLALWASTENNVSQTGQQPKSRKIHSKDLLPWQDLGRFRNPSFEIYEIPIRLSPGSGCSSWYESLSSMVSIDFIRVHHLQLLLRATLMSLLPAALSLPTDIEVFQQLHVEPHYRHWHSWSRFQIAALGDRAGGNAEWIWFAAFAGRNSTTTATTARAVQAHSRKVSAALTLFWHLQPC